MTPDAELLRAYARERSESAFAELVRRHLNLVYSVALRNLAGDTQLAEDVVQQVFADLAAKAGSLSRYSVLGGWLYRSTQFAAAKAVRGERRRRIREQEAQAMQTANSPAQPEPNWEKLRPTLDRLIGELDERDRDAVWLRFIANQSYAEIGNRLGLTENAARMRTDRALGKLHEKLTRAGITSSLAALGSALAGQVRGIAPAGLAGAVMQAVATVPAAGTALLGGSLAASLAIFFAGGLALGGAAAWALPENAISGQEPTMTARVLWSAGVTPAVKRLRTLANPTPVASTAPAATARPPEVDRILREVGLRPASDEAGPAPSWLNISAPKGYLVKSKEYEELSITAFEGRVDEVCAPLFARLKLDPEAIDRIRHALAEMMHARVVVDAAAGTRDPLPSPQEVRRLVETSDAEYRQKLRGLLGDIRFEQFEAYFDTINTRQQMRGIFSDIALRTSPLTPEQHDVLVAAFHADISGTTAAVPADSVLSPAQAELYERWREREVANQRSLLASLERYSSSGINRAIYRRAGANLDSP
jgi:RNA polymerase sigma factor (sigma-70 family)